MKRGERFVVGVSPELDPRSVEAVIHKLNVLLRASMIYSLKLEFNSALKVVIDLARELSSFNKAVFYLYDEEEKAYYPGLIDGFSEGLPPQFQRGNIFVDWTTENRLPIRIEEPNTPEIRESMELVPYHSMVSIPLLVGNDIHGVLQLFSDNPKNFNDEDVRFLWILTLQLEGLFHQIVRPLVHKVDDHDPFTGLPMKSHFDSELDREFLRSRRNTRPFSLFVIEIDNFFKLQEQRQSLKGGILLREVAEQIIPMVRKIDTFTRYSESTLALLLPETDLRDAGLLANRVRSRIAKATMTALGAVPELKLTVSIGVSGFPQAVTISDLLSEALKNLQAAQQSGGNRAISRYSGALEITDLPVSVDLQELLDTVGTVFDLESLLSHLVEFFSRLSGADRVSIMVTDETGDKLVFKHGVGFQGFEEEIRKTVLEVEDSICGQALKQKQPLLVDNVDVFMPSRAKHGLRYSSPSFLSIPLLFDGEAIGVINLSNRKDQGSFTQDDLDSILPHVQTMARLLAEGKRFSGIQREFLRDTAGILLNISEDKSPYMHGHSERVAENSYHLALALNVPESEALRIANAGRFHDLGRIAVDESILGKPGPLDKSEKNIIQQHPTWSARILQSFPNLNVDIPAVRAHHERVDGKGYPDGLMGEEIPLGGRILAVADAFDAMIHQRPHRPAISADKAFK
ncbi:MAG: GAF domain-containing protein, partial [Pseudomonadota bacterium]